MEKIAKKTLYISCFILIILLLIPALNWEVKKTHWYKNQLGNAEKIVFLKSYLSSNSTNTIDYIVLGSSSAQYSFFFKNDIKGINLSTGPASVELYLKALKQINTWTGNKKDNPIVIVTICPFSSVCGTYNTKKKAIDYPFSYYSHLSYLDDSLKTDFPNNAISYPILYRPVEALSRLILDKPEDTKYTLDYQPLQTLELENNARNMAWGWQYEMKFKNIPFTANEIPTHLKNAYQHHTKSLKQLVAYCEQNGYKIVYCIPPITRHLYKYFSESFIKTFVLDYIEETNTAGYPVFNYMNDSIFSNDSLFVDSYYMNQKGRELFTEHFIKELQVLGY